MQFSKILKALVVSGAVLATSQSFAAASRYSWVVNDLYTQNHPFAAQASNELATKMQKMNSSAFMFFRGSNDIFFKDMTTLTPSSYMNTATNQVWLQGDMHIANLGALRDDSGHDIFDISDFDEGYFGSYTWDLRRMAVSIVLAAQENGISASNQAQLVHDFSDAYFTKMDDFKGTSQEIGYILTTSNTSGEVKNVIQKEQGNSRSTFLAKYTTVSGNRQFQNLSDLVTVPSATYNAIVAAFPSYISSIPASKQYSSSYYTIKDIHQKLGSGTGSLGKMRYYVLVEGPSSSTSDDVIIEMKQQTASSVSLAAPGRMPASAYNYNNGYRMVRTAKAMMSDTDRLYGYTSMNSQDYSLREKSPFQEDFDYTKLTSYSSFKTAVQYAAQVIAKAHASSDQDYDATLNSYSEDKQITDVVTSRSSFGNELTSFATDYALQVQYDWASLGTALTNGATLY